MSDFDFVSEYEAEEEHSSVLGDNAAQSAINCAFVGVGGGGGKLAKAFLSVGFNKTLLVNTTSKDFGDPEKEGISLDHLLPLPGLDGVAKNISLGKKVLGDNSAIVEDTLRTRLGKVDWLFVCASGGGGTGSSSMALHGSFIRYLKSVEADGGVVYIVTKPTAQEMLNPTVAQNFDSLVSDLQDKTYILLDNERQLSHLRGRVGVADLYPAANRMFAKMFWNLLKYAEETSPIQAFDGKDLARFLRAKGRIIIGSAMMVPAINLGASLFQKCIDSSPCPKPEGRAKAGVLLEIISPELAADADVSGHLEAAASYVGGRSETLFNGVYVQDMPKQMKKKLVSIMALSGLESHARVSAYSDESDVEDYP